MIITQCPLLSQFNTDILEFRSSIHRIIQEKEVSSVLAMNTGISLRKSYISVKLYYEQFCVYRIHKMAKVMKILIVIGHVAT